ncbi:MULTISPECIES: glycosyltransferase [Aquincola]|uniref:glycosyltransferase n=1 Tax=Aquincola TaxID=391952 RepID=UPI000615353F|nr:MULTISPECIES: glycosyltransferase [Aquincola]MCR5869234.1 glycosyltransferase [Aquincola sp. J276]
MNWPLRVLMATVGSAGDIHPFLALGQALQARGHRVTLACPEPFGPLVAEAGLGFVVMGSSAQYEAVTREPDLWHPRKGFEVVWRHTRAGLRLLHEHVQALPAAEQPDVLVAHPLALPAADLCRALRPGLPIAGTWLAPVNLRTVHDPLMLGPLAVPRWVPLALRRWAWRRIDAGLLDPTTVPDINRERSLLGLPAVAHFVAHLQSVPDLSLLLFPPWFGPTQPDWPRPLAEGGFLLYDRPGSGALAPDLQEFLAAGTAPVVFTPGTGHRHAAAYFAAALQAVQALGRRAVFVTGHPEQLPAALPPTVIAPGYVSFRALLPWAAALVHHGGIGTTAEALRSGVPQLVLPFAHDQFDNARRVQALGVGDALPAANATSRRLQQRLGRLLRAPGAAAHRAEVAARLAAADPLPGLCEAIEALARRLKSPARAP